MLPTDVLRNCGTNVRQITNLASLHTVLYTRSTPFEYGRRDEVIRGLTELRREGALCVYSHNAGQLGGSADEAGRGSEDIWLFYATDSEPAVSVLELGFEVSREDTFEELCCHGFEDEIDAEGGVVVKDALLSAIEASLTHELWQSRAGTKIGSWTWLLHTGESDDVFGVIVTMQPRWKEGGVGTLHISTRTHASGFLGLSALASTHKGQSFEERNREVVVAPSGLRGLRVAEQDPNDETGARMPALASMKWKTAVRAALAAQGLEVNANDDWITICVKKGGDQFAWPAKLCFRMPDHESEPTGMFERSWKQYFAPPEGFEGDADLYRDPLAEAEEWFKSGTLNDTSVAKLLKGQQDQSMTEAPPGNTLLAPNGDVISPPLLLRPDLQATNLPYPTPPDGMAHGPPGSQALTSDSMPATQVPIDPQNQVHGASSSLFRTSSDPIASDEQVGNEDGDQRPRGPSIVSSVGAAHHFGQQNDDLFGDMDQVEFGGDDGEVGDADFSFFDEPDEVDGSVDTAPFQAQDTVAVQSSLPEAIGDIPDSTSQAAQESVIEMESLQPAIDNTNDGSLPALPAQPESDLASAPQPEVPTEPVQSTLQPPAPPPVKELKPLSPFSIREQLLPPPIPASIVPRSSGHHNSRRRSSFGPLVFKQGSETSQPYHAPQYEPSNHKGAALGYEKSRTFTSATSAHGLVNGSNGNVGNDQIGRAVAQSRKRSETPISSSDMDEDDDASVTSMSDEEGSKQVGLVAVSKKHKRGIGSDYYDSSMFSATPLRGRLPIGFRYEEAAEQIEVSDIEIGRRLHDLVDCHGTDKTALDFAVVGRNDHPVNSRSASNALEDNDKLSDKDLVMIAQIVAEQAITTTTSVAHEMDAFRLDHPSPAPSTQSAATDMMSTLLAQLLPSTKSCDAAALILPRESPNRPTPVSANSATKAQGQPRPPPARAESTLPAGPDISTLPAPYVRVRRAEDTLELLPTALPFWEALGLAPVSGRKDLRYYCVLPDSEDVEAAVDDFLVGLTRAYEGCKLGSHLEPAVFDEADAAGEQLGWARTVRLPMGEDAESRDAVLQGYASVCCELGEYLAPSSVLEPARTIVVYIVNPFSHASEPSRALHMLCAAFYELFTTYRKALLPLTTDKSLEGTQAADVVLQVLPIDLICRPSELVIPTAAQMARVARELYDRLPPSTRISGSGLSDTSPLPMPAAPCIQLAPALPKRINFQLAAQPPADLLHEGSVLHLSYCTSPDGKWIAASWIDATGAYSDNAVFALRGQRFMDIVEEIWMRTLLVLEARQVGWRVMVARTACHASGADMPDWEAMCWKTVVSDLTKRKQVTSITLLALDTAPDVQFSPSTAPDTGFLTPVSTPQPGGLTSTAPSFTVSPTPDLTPAPAATAPPTPVPSDAPAVLETDPDVHLVNLQDETYALLLSSPFNDLALASGLLLKRGTPSLQQRFPALGLSLAWTMHVRAGGGVVEGTGRHAEIMLREVMGMWRGLGVLGGFRGISEGKREGEGLVPVHVLAARRAARAVSGLVR